MRYVCKNPPGGGGERNPYQLIDYTLQLVKILSNCHNIAKLLPAYGVFISQLIRYARACSSFECIMLRATRLSNKLLEQGYVKERLNSSLKKFYGRYGDLIKQYEVHLSRMLTAIL